MLKTVHKLPPALSQITGLSADSRTVAPGNLFVAINGTQQEGRKYIRQAVKKGATALLLPEKTKLPASVDSKAMTVLFDQTPGRKLAELSAAFFTKQPDRVVAVTGTNGKSSVAGFLRQLWQICGKKAASLGTIGLETTLPLETEGLVLTTPDPVMLHKSLAELEKARITHLALEASSHGLQQYRLDGVYFAAAAFTNLSRDHLDYHSDMESYFQAKARLFRELLPEGSQAVINAGSSWGERICAEVKKRRLHLLRFGLGPGHDLSCLDIKAGKNGMTALSLSYRGKKFNAVTPLKGKFQIENILCAAGLAIATGEAPEMIFEHLGGLKAIKGRMDPVPGHPHGAQIFVDFAHTPDALKTVLTTLRTYCRGRLICLFGCGGDRDKGKRPQMGLVARQYADFAIVTDDNPRSENPAAIRRDILVACDGAKEIDERRMAIREGVFMLKPDDMLVIAGKGHEQGQIMAGITHPFDDHREARNAIRLLQHALGKVDA